MGGESSTTTWRQIPQYGMDYVLGSEICLHNKLSKPANQAHLISSPDDPVKQIPFSQQDQILYAINLQEIHRADPSKLKTILWHERSILKRLYLEPDNYRYHKDCKDPNCTLNDVYNIAQHYGEFLRKIAASVHNSLPKIDTITDADLIADITRLRAEAREIISIIDGMLEDIFDAIMESPIDFAPEFMKKSDPHAPSGYCTAMFWEERRWNIWLTFLGRGGREMDKKLLPGGYKGWVESTRGDNWESLLKHAIIGEPRCTAPEKRKCVTCGDDSPAIDTGSKGAEDHSSGPREISVEKPEIKAQHLVREGQMAARYEEVHGTDKSLFNNVLNFITKVINLIDEANPGNFDVYFDSAIWSIAYSYDRKQDFLRAMEAVTLEQLQLADRSELRNLLLIYREKFIKRAEQENCKARHCLCNNELGVAALHFSLTQDVLKSYRFKLRFMKEACKLEETAQLAALNDLEQEFQAAEKLAYNAYLDVKAHVEEYGVSFSPDVTSGVEDGKERVRCVFWDDRMQQLPGLSLDDEIAEREDDDESCCGHARFENCKEISDDGEETEKEDEKSKKGKGKETSTPDNKENSTLCDETCCNSHNKVPGKGKAVEEDAVEEEACDCIFCEPGEMDEEEALRFALGGMGLSLERHAEV